MSNLLEIRDVRKAYDTFALDSVSLTLPPGYIMGLIGPNGSGKTTLIKMIMNVVRHDAGTIHVLGSGMPGEGDAPPTEAVKQRIGFVQDAPTLYGHLTLSRMKSIVAGFYPTWDDAEFHALIERFELPLSRRVSALSRGMVTKFALCLALSHRAELVILDEPTTGLDPATRRDLLTVLASYIEDGQRSVLFSTHIVSDLERVADFITLLQAGRMVFSASKDDILESWALVSGDRRLLGDGCRELLEGWRENGHGVEALTSQVREVRAFAGEDVLVEKASLEEIMLYTSARHRSFAGGRSRPCSR